ncbi:TSUP family transporter [Actinokineospora sp. G85]|uniref:TSUP family transporter n=1 Tax=Actinokineospora sp. G85 TaxID=3406626 RepID=UPI003C73D5EF
MWTVTLNGWLPPGPPGLFCWSSLTSFDIGISFLVSAVCQVDDRCLASESGRLENFVRAGISSRLSRIIDAVLGLLGAGGSILAIPALVYGVGISLAAAVPVSLLVVAVSAVGAVAARLRTGVIRWPVTLIFAATSVPAAFAGTALGPGRRRRRGDRPRPRPRRRPHGQLRHPHRPRQDDADSRR